MMGKLEMQNVGRYGGDAKNWEVVAQDNVLLKVTVTDMALLQRK
jgi:hypothetical protein